MISQEEYIEQKMREIETHFLSLDTSNMSAWEIYTLGFEKGGLIALGF